MARPRNPPRARAEEQESLVLADGAGETELAHQVTHSQHHPEDLLFESQEEEDAILKEELEQRRHLPWFKQPSAVWFLVMIPFIIAAATTTHAPRIEVITDMVCRTLRPEYTAGSELLVRRAADPRIKLCNSDPAVQAATAKFLIVLNTATGALSCLTTAWWGSLSDRKGRIATMRICMIGLLTTELGFIFVFKVFANVRGGYWLLLVGPCIEGLLGSLSAASANIHAYIADCTEPAKRSRTFSLYLGLFFAGVAFGPALGSLIIHQTQQAISVFYFAVVVHLGYAFMVWFVIPESLSRSQLARARRTHSNSKADNSRNSRYSIKRLLSFLAPLSLFVPTQTAGTHPFRKRRDWNLTLLAAAYGFAIMMMGSFPFKFQYASLTFGWDSEMLGYWMSIVGVTRAIFLTMILPVVISLFKPKSAVRLYSQPEAPGPEAHASSSDSDISETEPLHPPKAPGHDHRHSTPILDLNIARASLIVEMTAYVLMPLATTGTFFTLWTAVGSLGAGFSPAVQSLSLAIYTSRGGKESGSLFGALSVVNALGQQMLSPLLFGLIYAATVGTFPQAIFVTFNIALLISLVLLSLIRLPKAGLSPENGGEEAGAAEPFI